MRPLPIRYVRDLPAAQRFYEALGLDVDFAGRAPRQGGTRWVELVGSARAVMALHYPDDADAPIADEAVVAEPADPGHAAAPSGGLAVELAFEAEEPLEEVVARLRAAGFEPATAIVDESHGRSFTVRDPEGLRIQVNEHDRALDG